MGFPASRRGAPGSAAARACANPITAVAKHLKTYHDGHFMVLNVSEETYDYRRFEDNALEFKFPGHPGAAAGHVGEDLHDPRVVVGRGSRERGGRPLFDW